MAFQAMAPLSGMSPPGSILPPLPGGFTAPAALGADFGIAGFGQDLLGAGFSVGQPFSRPNDALGASQMLGMSAQMPPLFNSLLPGTPLPAFPFLPPIPLDAATPLAGLPLPGPPPPEVPPGPPDAPPPPPEAAEDGAELIERLRADLEKALGATKATASEASAFVGMVSRLVQGFGIVECAEVAERHDNADVIIPKDKASELQVGDAVVFRFEIVDQDLLQANFVRKIEELSRQHRRILELEASLPENGLRVNSQLPTGPPPPPSPPRATAMPAIAVPKIEAPRSPGDSSMEISPRSQQRGTEEEPPQTLERLRADLDKAEAATKSAAKEANAFVGVVSRLSITQSSGAIECAETTELHGKVEVLIQKDQVSGLQVGDSVVFRLANVDGEVLRASFVRKVAELSQQRQGILDVEVPLPAPSAVESDQEYVGVVSSFRPYSGYGFLSCAQTMEVYGSDVYIHRDQYTEFNIGDAVHFRVAVNSNKVPVARQVRKALSMGFGRKTHSGSSRDAIQDATPPPLPPEGQQFASTEREAEEPPRPSAESRGRSRSHTKSDSSPSSRKHSSKRARSPDTSVDRARSRSKGKSKSSSRSRSRSRRRRSHSSKSSGS